MLNTIEHKPYIASASFSQTGKFIATHNHGEVKIWRTETTEPVIDKIIANYSRDYVWKVFSVPFLRDDYVLTYNEEHIFSLWSSRDGSLFRELSAKDQFNAFSTIEFFPEQRLVLAGSLDGSVLLVKLNNAYGIQEVTNIAAKWNNHLSPSLANFSPDKSMIALGGGKHDYVLIYDLFAKDFVWEKRHIKSGGGILNIKFSPDGKNLAISTAGGKVLIIKPDIFS